MDDFINLIEFWNFQIKNTSHDSGIYEAAFLRIYIEFENFLRKTFVLFSLGQSYSSYVPVRKLAFQDENQLSELIRGEAKFVDYMNAISRCSKHIFEKDPFNVILNAKNFHDDLIKMKRIRDYLAHRSTEAKGRYEKQVLNSYGITEYIEPGFFLQRKMKNLQEAVYSYYCGIFLDIIESFSNDIILNNL